MKSILKYTAVAMILATPTFADHHGEGKDMKEHKAEGDYAMASLLKKQSNAGVDETIARLTETVEGAGGKVFAVVDHGAGAESVDQPIGASKLVIFGNPKIGTPVMTQDKLAGLALPGKFLIYDDEAGDTWIAYEDIEGRMKNFDGVDAKSDAVKMLSGAFDKISSAASGQ